MATLYSPAPDCFYIVYPFRKHDNIVSLVFVGLGDSDEGADQGDEPKLHRVQVPPDQSPPMAKGRQNIHFIS